MKIIIIVFGLAALLVVIVTRLIVGKAKKEVWEGELIDKREEIMTLNDSDTTNYSLYVKTNQGLEKKVYVKRKLYETLNIGDQLIKVKGEASPRKSA